MQNHTLLEIRTGRDGKKEALAMSELLSSLPCLRDDLLNCLLGKNEIVSFEIALENQLVTFFIYSPNRLVETFKGLLGAHYPEATITPLGSKEDPLAHFQPVALNYYREQNLHPDINTFSLEKGDCYPLKDWREFKDNDCLAPLLSHLSQAAAGEKVIIQYLITPSDDNWKKSCQRQIEPNPNENSTSAISPQMKTLIEQKIQDKSFLVNLNIATLTKNKERAEFFFNNLESAFANLQKEGSNALKRHSPLLTERRFRLMSMRQMTKNTAFHLSLHELASLFHFPNHKVATIPNLAWGKNLLGEPPANLPIVRKEHPLEMKKEINVFAETLYKNEVNRYGIRRADRRRHMYVIGKTGTGKSTMLANMAINDLRNNEGLCFIDPHGDAIDILLNYIPSNRINDVVFFNPADGERTVKINLFEGENIEHRELIASGIVAIFQKLYSYSWGPRLEHFLRNALLTLLQMDNARLSDIIQLFTEKEFRQKVISQINDPVIKSFWLGEFEPLQDRMKNEAVAPILNKVGQFVSSPLVRNVVNADKSSFSIEQIMDEGKILLVNLSQGLLGEDNATLLGAMLITKIQLAAMARVHVPEESRRDFYLYVDEFQNFATTSFNKILSEARKYRLNLILANQYIAQIPEEVQKAIFGNCGSIVSFVMGSEDAQVFSREYGEKYTYDDLVSLNRHQIINRISIDNILSHPFPAYTLPLAAIANQNRQKVIRVSRERYATKKDMTAPTVTRPTVSSKQKSAPPTKQKQTNKPAMNKNQPSANKNHQQNPNRAQEQNNRLPQQPQKNPISHSHQHHKKKSSQLPVNRPTNQQSSDNPQIRQ